MTWTPSRPSATIAHLKDNPRVRIVRADLMRLHELIAACEGMDGVLHLAAYMTLGFSQTPWEAVDVNVRGVQNEMVVSPVSLYILMSSPNVK